MGILNIGRIIALSFTIFALFAATGLVIASLFLQNWQTVDITDTRETHWHGLWEDCVKGGSRQVAVAKDTFICTYKDFKHPDTHTGIGQEDRLHQTNHHDGEQWRLATLCLISIASFLGIFALLLAFGGMCVKACAIVSTILTALAAACTVAGVVVFTRNAKEPNAQLILGITTSDLQHFGLAYYLAVGSSIAFSIAAFISVLATCLTFMARNEDERKTWPKNTTI